MLCALSRNDLDAAKSAFFSMVAETQRDPMTQYLMYRTTIRSGDISIASECLENVAASSISRELLFACVADSQRLGNRFVTHEAMKKLADAYDPEEPGKLHLPALLRCCIMLQHGLLSSDENADRDQAVAEMCKTFERGESARSAISTRTIKTDVRGLSKLFRQYRERQRMQKGTDSLMSKS